MIDPSDIDFDELPSVSLKDRDKLPETPSIYFAMSKGKVQYIGLSKNPRERWKNHHRQKKLSKMSDVVIAYLDCPQELLRDVEQALIKWFDPPLNNANSAGFDGVPMKVRKVIDQDVSGLGARIKAARESDERSLTAICAEAKMTAANWYKIENEETKVLPLETLQKMEEVLGIDLGVRFD